MTAAAWPGTPVPGNRWDQLDGREPERWPPVGVVIPYYRQQDTLDLVLAALAEQRYPGRVHMVVADDGSPEPPRVPPGVRVVRQDDHGFRAATARNLGARSVAGDVLTFLDADTVPEPDYLRHAVRLPALSAEALVVGRRRRARLTGPGADSWPPRRPLEEPRWLTEGYTGSRNLLDADDRSYRFVLSSVLTCHRLIFDEIGGFDETLVGYGGEDWEFAHRAWQAGALLAHEPRAVAWHDGPDFAGRDEPARRATRTAETLALSTRVPVPGSRAPGVVGAVPDVVVRVLADKDPVTDPAALLATVIAVLAADGAVVRLPIEVPGLLASDPRVTGTGDPDPPGPARATVLLRPGVRPRPGALDSVISTAHRRGHHTVRLEVDGSEVGTLHTRRGRNRRDRWGRACADTAGCAVLDALVTPRPDLEAVFGGWG